MSEENNNEIKNEGQIEGDKNLMVDFKDEEKNKKAEDKVIIHTMPKRFYSSSAGYDKSKKVGVIIISIGVFFLVAIAIFLYFFFIKSPEEIISVPVVNTGSSSDVKTPVGTTDNKKDNQVKDDSSNNGVIDKNEVTDKENDIKNDEKNIEILASSTPEIIDKVEEIATTTPELVEDKVKIKTAVDSDKDGLTDSEENIFGTILNLRDSDGDGYDDLSEVLSLYNPAGEGSIIVNAGIEKYTNSKNSYSLYYPKIMSFETVGGSEDSMIFKFPNGQIIQVIVEPNQEKLSIIEWYKKQFGVDSIKNDQQVYKKGWTGVRSEDGLVVYLTNPGSSNIYTLAYNISADYTLTYKNIFELMINSLELK